MNGGTDPLALIIGAGGAAIGALSMIVWTMLLARVSRMEKDIKEVGGHLIGDTGLTIKMADINGRVRTLEAEVTALKGATLTKELFERETERQNEKLDELKAQTAKIERKVEKASPGGYRSYSPPESPVPPLPPRRTNPGVK